jgi:hypothetical protein
MSDPRLPGPWLIATLMLAAALTGAVAITGPIPVRYDVIKDFQPIIAAAAVLAAGAFGYWAVKERIGFDRRVHDSQEERRRQNLVTKVRYAALMFHEDIKTVREIVFPKVSASTEFGRYSPRDSSRIRRGLE